MGRFLRLFLAAIFSAFATIGCSTFLSENSLNSQSETVHECRIIQHKLGESCVPLKPQRIIALEASSWILDPLLALGVKPVGAVPFYAGSREYYPGLSADEVAGIESVGTSTGPSIEKILSLNPDLILSLASGEKIYPQLSEIAPTVVREYEDIKLSFKENIRSIAQIVGREDEAESILMQYQKEVKNFREKLASQIERPEISVITYYSGEFSVPASYAPFFQILSDLGVKMKPVFTGQIEYIPISIEAVKEYDTDILFIVDFDDKPASFFLENSLISSLESAKDGRLHLVKSDIWWSYGPLGIDKLLDELSYYLLDDD